MTSLSRKKSLLWALIPLGVLLLVAWFDRSAINRNEAVSALFDQNLILVTDGDSLSGYAEGRRRQIVPGHNLESYEWIVQAEAILHSGEWRQREVEYDNAPIGRTVQSPSAVRWWLATVAKLFGKGDTTGARVTDAAAKADVILQFVLIVGFTLIAAWRWGMFPAAVGAVVLGLGYPVIGGFYPGAPTSRGLTTLLTAGTLLTFLVGFRSALRGETPKLWWMVAGVLGGVTIWVSPQQGYPLTGMLVFAILVASWLQRRTNKAEPIAPLPWLIWAISGAGMILLLFLVDYRGTEIEWSDGRLHQLHPVYALSWLGMGWLGRVVQQGTWNRRALLQILGAVLLTSSVVAMQIVNDDDGFLTNGLGTDLMTHLPDAATSASFGEWVNQHATKGAAAGVFLPLGFLGGAIWWLVQNRIAKPDRGALVAAGLITAITLALSLVNLNWWSSVFVGLAVTVVILAHGISSSGGRLVFMSAALLSVGCSWFDLAPRLQTADDPELTSADIRSLAERDLAHWLSLRNDEYRSVVLSPPSITPALYFYGGVRGLGSPYAENSEGFIAAVRIASASSPDESLALATQRELSHVVIPTWDDFLDEYARLGASQPEHSMVAMLHNWLAPRWMRPVQHMMPAGDIFTPYSTVIFEVTETQDNATALSRLGEYFAETKQPQYSSAVAVTLQQSFPSDLSGLVAQAQIAVTQGKVSAFNDALSAIKPYVEEERDGDLEFDRRVSLANVLMLGREAAYAREQVGYCMDEVDEYLLTTVSAPNLYRFILLAQSVDEPFPEPELETLARQLLPAQLRSRL